jgi:hypothetical protein
MHLIYFDESGNSGNKLTDENQPVFVLCALMVRADEWQEIEAELDASRLAIFPTSAEWKKFEVHAKDLTSPRKNNFFFDKKSEDRLKLYRDWIRIAQARELKVFYKAIVKKRYATWLAGTFRNRVRINPQVAAFAFLSQVINQHLAALKPASLGIFISDENREVVTDVEEAIRALRIDSTSLRLSQIIEKGFFIESRKSLLLQLCDLCTFCARKREDEKIGRPLNSTNKSLASLLEPIIYRGREAMIDILGWLQNMYGASDQKKS